MMIIAAPFLLALAFNPTPAHDITPGRLRSDARILLDTRCGDVEWMGAARVSIGDGRELLAIEDATSLYLCIPLPAESYGTMDLYVLPSSGAAPLNLHASAQVGERTKVAEAWPDWTFGNHHGWYSPPVAVTRATLVD